MANYYCLMAELPVLSLSDARPQHTTLQMKETLADVLTSTDALLMERYFLRFDCENLASLLEGSLQGTITDETSALQAGAEGTATKDQMQRSHPFDERGNYGLDELQTLVDEARSMDGAVKGFPAFLADFVRDFDAHKENSKKWFARDAVLLAYYDYARECPNTFMAQWYELNLNILNILTALIARKQGWSLNDYVQGSSYVAESILKQATQPDFGLGAELNYVKELMQAAESTDPVEKERQIDALRWNWLEERTFFEPFDITALFSYIVRSEILERWALLDPEQGRQRFTQIIENLRGEAKVPEEFIRK